MQNQAKPDNGRYGPIEVFRAGTFTPLGGGKQEMSVSELRAIADTYDATLAPAPVVVGHPAIDAPAYGWVEYLYEEAGILKAVIKDIEPAFADQVRAGRYRKVSISLFLPNSTSNPKPGSFYLRHVGFLGGAAPAVPNLKPVAFSNGGADTLPLVQDFGAAALDFSASAELQRMRDQLANDRAEIALEKLIEAGKVLPAFKEEILSFAAGLGEGETVSFSDGTEKPKREWFFDYLSRQPQVVSYGALDLEEEPRKAPRRGHARVPEGYTIDRTHSDTHAKASQIAKERGISYADAVDIVCNDE